MSSSESALARFLEDAGPVMVLTGAGVSTASGIPGYRDRNGNWKNAAPVQFSDFMQREAVRRRYWARSFAGWNRFSAAIPNDAHRSLAALEHSGIVDTLVTQNVDGLHRRAGHRNVIDLHGRLDGVRCQKCTATVRRSAWQERLLDANPAWQSHVASVKPDGDAEIDGGAADGFRVPDCDGCGGIMKPDVVFFGESVPGARVERAKAALARSGGLLVVGSSLMVFSGFRFARLAREFGKSIAIVNQGVTRADGIAALRLDGDCGDVLANTLGHLDARRAASGLPS